MAKGKPYSEEEKAIIHPHYLKEAPLEVIKEDLKEHGYDDRTTLGLALAVRRFSKKDPDYWPQEPARKYYAESSYRYSKGKGNKQSYTPRQNHPRQNLDGISKILKLLNDDSDPIPELGYDITHVKFSDGKLHIGILYEDDSGMDKQAFMLTARDYFKMWLYGNREKRIAGIITRLPDTMSIDVIISIEDNEIIIEHNKNNRLALADSKKFLEAKFTWLENRLYHS